MNNNGNDNNNDNNNSNHNNNNDNNGMPPNVAAAVARLTPPGQVPPNELVPGRFYKVYNLLFQRWEDRPIRFIRLLDMGGYYLYVIETPYGEMPVSATTSPLYNIVDRLAKNALERRGHALAAWAKARANAENNNDHANGGNANGGHANGGNANGGHANGGNANGGHANGGHANGGLPNNANRNKNKGSNTKKNERRRSARKQRKTRRY